MATFEHQTLTVTETAVGLTVTKGTSYACISIETAAVRIRLDGTDASGTVGFLVTNGQELTLFGEDALNDISFFADTSTDAVLNIASGRDNSGRHGIAVNG